MDTGLKRLCWLLAALVWVITWFTFGHHAPGKESAAVGLVFAVGAYGIGRLAVWAVQGFAE